MRLQEIDQLLAQARPQTAHGADALLDLRELLLSKGHPGECVHCFFSLMGDLTQPKHLAPLKKWLEAHLEIQINADGKDCEALPVELGEAETLAEFCDRTIHFVRHDRAYIAEAIHLSFQYKEKALVA